MSTPHSNPEHRVTISVPGVEGVWVVYDQDHTPVDPQRLEAGVLILAHWLRKRAAPLSLETLRGALRQFHEPRLLGHTELARMLFSDVVDDDDRGFALRSLLSEMIAQLDSGPDASPKERRSFDILRQLYISRRHRLVICADLGISERQYQRELHAALTRLAGLLS